MRLGSSGAQEEAGYCNLKVTGVRGGASADTGFEILSELALNLRW